MKVIGLTGFPRAGKDLASSLIIEIAWAAEHAANRIGFADALKIEVAAAYPDADEILTDPTAKDKPWTALTLDQSNYAPFVSRMREIHDSMPGHLMTQPRSPREIWQLWGTQFRRAQNPNYWIDRARETTTELRLNGCELLVFTYTRFINEAQFIQQYRAPIWKISRPGFNMPAEPASSDLELLNWPFDRIVVNDGSPDKYRKKLADLMLPILGEANVSA